MTLNNLAAGWQALFSEWAHVMYWYLKGYNPLTIHIITLLPETFFYLFLWQLRARSSNNGRYKKENVSCSLSVYLAWEHSANWGLQHLSSKALVGGLSCWPVKEMEIPFSSVASCFSCSSTQQYSRNKEILVRKLKICQVDLGVGIILGFWFSFHIMFTTLQVHCCLFIHCSMSIYNSCASPLE